VISSERKNRISVVEDDDKFRKLLSEYLEKNGFIVYSAADGSIAILPHSMQEFLLDRNITKISFWR